MSEKARRYLYSLMTDEAKGPAAAVLKALLSLISFVYFCALEAVVFLYRTGIFKSYRPACKVISVGNITLGGTGKTPLTVAIARKFKDEGKKVVILTRGYMRKGKTGLADEAELFREALTGIPVLVDRDRISSAKEAEAKYRPDIILLDDGFQHWRLKRDMDVVTVDVNNPFGNSHLIPRGILREPLSSLNRAHVIVVTKVLPEMASLGKAENLKDRIKHINGDIAVFNASYYPSRLYEITGGRETAVESIADRSVALLCAIADPSSFEDTVISLGANVKATYYFMDHHRYAAGELNKAIEECKAKRIDTIVTTEKDLPRIKETGVRPQESGVAILALAIEARVDNEEQFFGRLNSIFTGKA